MTNTEKMESLKVILTEYEYKVYNFLANMQGLYIRPEHIGNSLRGVCFKSDLRKNITWANSLCKSLAVKGYILRNKKGEYAAIPIEDINLEKEKP